MNFLTRNLVIREPLVISLLVLLTIACFAFTHGYSQAYDRRRTELGREWLQRASSDLLAGRGAAAVEEFRTALVYTPQSWECRLGLAEALMRSGQTRQAQEYFASLWQSQPQNGVVNLQLARLAAHAGKNEEAQRYYTGAIFGDWSENADESRRDAAFELIDFYLQRHNLSEAESQLLTLSGNLPDDAALQVRVADLFARVGDYSRSLDFYKRAARHEPKNLEALVGAGNAALQLGDYRMAENYFSRALHEDDSNAVAARQRELAQTVLQLDPLERGINAGEKARRTLRSFEIAGERLKSCTEQRGNAVGGNPTAAPLAAYAEKWNQWKPSSQLSSLIRNPDQADELFDFSLQAEQATQTGCGQPTMDDNALLALLHKRSSEDK